MSAVTWSHFLCCANPSYQMCCNGMRLKTARLYIFWWAHLSLQKMLLWRKVKNRQKKVRKYSMFYLTRLCICVWRLSIYKCSSVSYIMKNNEERNITMLWAGLLFFNGLVKWLLWISLLIFNNVATLMSSQNFREKKYATLVSSHLTGFDLRI